MEEQSVRVLLIEDDLDDVRLVRFTLSESRSQRFELTHTVRLEAGLKHLAERRFDVVLLDLSLPDETGLETLSRVCTEQPGVPVVVLTGLDDESLAVRAVQQGAQDYLFKSELGTQLLARAMRYAIERKRAEEERKSLELRLQRAQKLESLGVLAGGIAHDFNNLLAGILGNASLALMELPAEAAGRRFVQQIEKAAQRAAGLTAQMLAYSGRGRFVSRPVQLAQLVEEMRGSLGTPLPKPAQLRFDFRDSPVVEADPVQLQQVVTNLVTNASEALGDGGTITVRTGLTQAGPQAFEDSYTGSVLPAGSYAFLEVEDTGCGMDEATRARAFEPFFSTKKTGRGLGLAAVLGIVRAHRGAIELDSEPGRGTRFTLLLPRSAAAAEQLPLGSAGVTDGALHELTGQGNILVVDDEQSLRTMACRILEKSGYTVLCAADGPEALHRFEHAAASFDAVLLDLTMPRMSGTEVLHRLTGIRPDVRVLLCSGYSQADFLPPADPRTVTDFLPKPYTAAALLSKLRALLQRPPAGAA